MGVLFFWTRYSLSENGREIRKKSIFTKLKKSAITDIFGGWVIKYQVGPNIRPTCSQNFRPLAPKLTKIERFKVGVLFHMKCKYLKIREISKISKISGGSYFEIHLIFCTIMVAAYTAIKFDGPKNKNNWAQANLWEVE